MVDLPRLQPRQPFERVSSASHLESHCVCCMPLKHRNVDSSTSQTVPGSLRGDLLGDTAFGACAGGWYLGHTSYCDSGRVSARGDTVAHSMLVLVTRQGCGQGIAGVSAL